MQNNSVSIICLIIAVLCFGIVGALNGCRITVLEMQVKTLQAYNQEVWRTFNEMDKGHVNDN